MSRFVALGPFGACADPTFNPPGGTYTTTQTVTIATTTTGAQIRYTTDGSDPGPNVGTLIPSSSGTVTVAVNLTIKAIAFKPNFRNSNITSATYNVSVVAPVYSPAPGGFNTAQTVTISTTTAGAHMYYTTDGTTPAEGVGTLINGTSGTVSVAVNLTLKAIALKPGWNPSAVTSGNYTFTPITPTFSPAAGGYSDTTTVTIATTTTGCTMYYTTDGSVPSNTNGTLINGSSGTVTITHSLTLRALAYKTGWSSSGVVGGTYTLTAITPTFSPAGGTYSNGAISVTLNSASTGAIMRYTLDGTIPSPTNGTLINSNNGTVSLQPDEGGTTLKAIAFQTGWTASGVHSDNYLVLSGTVANVTFSLVGGTYHDSQSTTLSTSTLGCNIRYTTDGSTPSRSIGTLIAASSGSVSIAQTETIKAIAFQTNWIDSNVTQATYTLAATAPTFNPVGGTYATGNKVITISTTSTNAIMRYTVDGTTPTPSVGTLINSNSGTATLTPDEGGTTLKAVAYQSSWTTSAVTTDNYVILNGTVATPTYNQATGTYTVPVGGTLSVVITSTTAGASIRYTTNGTTPTRTNGTLIANGGTAQVPIGTFTLKSIAFKTDWIDSAIKAVAYTVQAYAGVTHTYDSGSGNETVPTNSSSLTITCWGAGGGGGFIFNTADLEDPGGGAGAGGYCTRTVAIISGDWGTNIPYAIGTAGAAHIDTSTGAGLNGGNSTANISVLTNAAVNMAANGGTGGAGDSVSTAAGGTATGGSTNISGGNGATGISNGAGGQSPNAAAGVGTGGNGGVHWIDRDTHAPETTEPTNGSHGRITWVWS